MPVRIAVGGRKKTSLPRGLYFREWPQCSGCQRETFLVAHGQWPHSLYLLQHTRPHTMPLHFIILQHKQHKKRAFHLLQHTNHIQLQWPVHYISCNTHTQCALHDNDLCGYHHHDCTKKKDLAAMERAISHSPRDFW